MPLPLRHRGSTLILVLIVASLLALLAFSTGGLAQHASRASFAERERALTLYSAEAAIEALRLQLIRHYEASGMARRTWLKAVQEDHDYRVHGAIPSDGIAAPVDWQAVGPRPVPPPPGTPAVGAASYQSLPGVRAWVDAVSLEQGWVDLVAAPTPDFGSARHDPRSAFSVRLRLTIFRNAIFDLALLTEDANCTFCHLHVRGDVGAIGFFRPGYGTENGKGRFTGAGSTITGDVYLAGRASDDADWRWSDDELHDSKLINGTLVSGSVRQFYRGPYLPEDSRGNDGVPDFPSFDPAEVERRARDGAGRVWVEGGAFGGRFKGKPGMWIVPFGRDWSERGAPGTGALDDVPESLSVIEGNLVLVGSDDDRKPITIAGNVFVQGDLVIKGYVEGRGAIYAGRNVYIAGDVRYVDEPGAGWPLAGDQAAVDAIQEGVSELRLAARSTIVVGDWTYLDEQGEVRRVAERQAQDFFSAQFDLDRVRFYEASDDGVIVSHELRQDPASGRFMDDQGRFVSNDRIARTKATRLMGKHVEVDAPRYDAALAPGNVIREGLPQEVGEARFDPWIGQPEFREILGTQLYPLITFRVPGTVDPAERAFELGEAWVKARGMSLPRSIDPRKRRLYTAELLWLGKAGMLVFGGFNDETWHGALIAEELGVGFPWPTQVGHIDAYLFANRRIAGKTDEGALTVNGGLAAAEIGLLAPGWNNRFIDDKAHVEGSEEIPRWVYHAFRPGHADHPRNAYGHLENKTRIYYDFRLRNGGFGYDFLASTGDTLFYTREGEAHPPHGAGLEGLNLFPER